MLLLVASAHADELRVGGAVDVVGGVDAESGAAVVGLRQLEGDLRAGSGALAFELQLDTAATFTGDGVFLYALGPERLVGEGLGKDWRLSLGIEKAPFRVESVDPWHNALVSYTMLSRHVPDSVLGAALVLGPPQTNLTLLAGGQLGSTNVFAFEQWTPMPFLVGARGKFDVDAVELAAGAWAGGLDRFELGGLELAARVDAGLVGAQAEVVSNLSTAHAASVQGELWPRGLLSPVARVEVATEGLGVAAGLSSTLFDLLRLKAEAGYQAGAAGIYVEAAVFSAWPGDDAPRGGDTSPTTSTSRD